jgi:hypothetical protein
VRLPVVVLDCLGDTIEVPLLGLGVDSPSLEPDVVSTVAFNHSTEWKIGLDVEWSVDMETKVFGDTLNLRTLSFVKINNLPFLVSSVVVTENTNCSTFFILTSSNIKHLVVIPVDELAILILENLPPTRVSAPDLHVLCSTRALDIPRLVVQSSSDCQ